jgi:hypothetical protein
MPQLLRPWYRSPNEQVAAKTADELFPAATAMLQVFRALAGSSVGPTMTNLDKNALDVFLQLTESQCGSAPPAALLKRLIVLRPIKNQGRSAS